MKPRVSSRPTPAEVDAALETLIRALEPHIAGHVKGLLNELLKAGPVAASSAPLSEEQVNQCVHSLSSDVLEGGLILFEALQSERREIDSITLADRAGVSTRELSGRIIRPLQGVIDTLRLETPWTVTRAAPSGGLGARTVWRVADRDTARLLYEAFENASPPPSATNPPAELSRRVLPSAVFPYSPEYARGASEEREGWSSCLRDSEPGSRAVIYRVHSEQGIVALFDIEGWPTPDRDWGYGAEGYFTPIKPAISRARLLDDPALEPVFQHIQGRRRLPATAQAALAELIEKQMPLPDHSLAGRSRTSKRKR
jgi:hypothetical protein